MTLWTVMFGDDPLKRKKTGSTSARVKVFGSRRSAYGFKEFCVCNGIHADVVFHPRPDIYPTFH